MKLTLQLSCYNGARYLPTLLASVRAQTFSDWRLVVLDNASTPEEATLIGTHLEASGVAHELFRVEQNIGFAGAHAFLFEQGGRDGEYVALLNDDARLEPGYLENLVAELDAHPECAAVEGVVYRWNYDARNEADGGRTIVVDTAGLKRDWLGRISDRGANKTVAPEALPTSSFRVWGVSGCLPMYRVEAIRSATPDQSIFDKRLRLYKEDVELSWSLGHDGWSARTVPAARAYHRRSYGATLTTLNRPLNEAASLSYRNHLWLLFAHSGLKDLLTHPGIIPFELAKAFYWLVRKPSIVIQGWKDTWQARAHLKEKRAHFLTKKTIRSNGVRREPKANERVADIAIITVTHNDVSEAYLKSVKAAKEASPELRIETVIVDNKSKHDVRASVQAVLPDAWVLLRNGDHGFGRSCNFGADHVQAKYYFFLNPDTALSHPTIFRDLMAASARQNDNAIIGPQIHYPDGRYQETRRRFPRWFMPFVQRTGLGETAWGKAYAHSFLMRDTDHMQEQPVGWIQGSAMFIPAKIWWLLGGFDDRFWLYFEDMDLCRRAWVAGHKVIYDPAQSLMHAHGKASAKYKNHFVNLLANEEARAHIKSWLQYELRWLGRTPVDVK